MRYALSRLAAGTVAAFAALASAHANLVVNGSFEDGLTGWASSGAVETTTANFPSDGLAAAVFNQYNAVPSGIISQSVATVPGTRYQLQFDYWGWAKPKLQSLEVTVAGTATLLSKTVSAEGSGYPVTYHTAAWIFTADSTLTTLTFRDVTKPKNTYVSDLMLDRVSVAEYVPHVAGTLDGYRHDGRLSVVCANLTTGLSVKVNTLVFDCGEAGLAIAAGDKVKLTVRGVAR